MYVLEILRLNYCVGYMKIYKSLEKDLANPHVKKELYVYVTDLYVKAVYVGIGHWVTMPTPSM